MVLFGAITVVFFLFQLKPGNAARSIAGQHASAEAIENIERKHNLDLPIWEQYLLYLNDISPISIHNTIHTDSRIYADTATYDYQELISFSNSRTLVVKVPHLRSSFKDGRPVNQIVEEALPGTIVLAFVSMLFATLFGVLFGVLAAIWKGSFFDNGSLVLAVLGMSAPSYFTAIIIAWIGGYLWYETSYLPALPLYFLGLGMLIGLIFNKRFNKNPFGRFSYDYLFQSIFRFFSYGVLVWLGGYSLNVIFKDHLIPLIDHFIYFSGTGLSNTGSLYEADDLGNEFLALENLILPALTLGIRPLAVILQLTRSSMLEVMAQDYIRTARAKGLSTYKIVVRHAVKNTLNPVITAVSGWFASLLAGAVFIEVIFSWKGLGYEVYTGLINDDFPIVLGSVLVIATSFVFINTLVDIVYGIIDPRIRVK